MKVKIILNSLSINGRVFHNGDTFETDDKGLVEALKVNKFAEEIREERVKKVDKLNELD